MVMPKYMSGDLVRLVDEYPESMKYFSGRGSEAIILSCFDFVDGTRTSSKEHQYKLFIKDRGPSAWYPESVIHELLDVRRVDILAEWLQATITTKVTK